MMGQLRLLGLHGRYQCSQIFASKLGASRGSRVVRLGANSLVEIVCIDAPFQVEPKIKLKSAKKKDTVVKLRQWWEPLPSQRQLDLSEALRYLKGEIKDKGPFDGVLGFSQGGALASLLCTIEVSEEMGFRPEVAILCSAYEHKDTVEQRYLESVKTLHLYGANDKVVPSEVSADLCLKMKGLELSHELGHVLSTDHIERGLKLLL